ncbi:hypothetical protein J3A83DRAFT_4205727 [Scleroderma citrinum]
MHRKLPPALIISIVVSRVLIGQKDPPYCVPNGDVCPHKYPCCSGHCDQDRHVCTVSYHRAALIISIAVSRVLIPFDSNHRSSCPRCFYTIHRRRMSRTLAGSSL